MSSDRFVDEWVRFAAHFEAIEKTRRYKLHTRAQRRETSLAEFGRYPPQEYEDLAATVAEGVDAVKDTFELAEKANKALAWVRTQGVQRDRDIARARDHARRTNASSVTTGEERARAAARVAKLRDDKTIRANEARLAADDAVNDVAASRIIAIQLLAEVRKLAEDLIVSETEPAPDTP